VSITTYQPTRSHRNAAGLLVRAAAGRCVRGWAARSSNAVLATKRFRIAGYYDGLIAVPGSCGCNLSSSNVWDGTFPGYVALFGGQWNPAAPPSGYISISGRRCWYNDVYIWRCGQNDVPASPDSWPSSVAAVPGAAGANLLRIRCGGLFDSGYLWIGVCAQPQVVAGADVWPLTMAGVYTRGDGFANAPATLTIEAY
jgi:hypothetical protein